MSNGTIYLFRTNGSYFGFVSSGAIFSRDGVFMGWIEGQFAWDPYGQYRGQLVALNGNWYILKHLYAVPPLPRIPKIPQISPAIPVPVANVSPIVPPIGYVDGFS